jgi:hypothetical protein
MHEELITKNIKDLRKQKKMKLQQLADLTGLTKGYKKETAFIWMLRYPEPVKAWAKKAKLLAVLFDYKRL